MPLKMLRIGSASFCTAHGTESLYFTVCVKMQLMCDLKISRCE